MLETRTGTSARFHDHLKQTIAEGIMTLDDQGIVTAANDAAARILGYEPEALIGRSWTEFWPETTTPNQFSIGKGVEEQKTMRQQDGRSIPVNLTVTPVSDHITSTTLVSFTSRKDIEQMNEALTQTQRLAGIGILTASVAHELNTPISIIAATCSNILHEVEDNSLSMEQLLHYIEMIEQSAWRSARIVEVLRNYSYEDDKAQTAVTDLNMIVEDALTLVRHQFRGEFNIKIETDFAPNLKSIVCDHNRLTQVLINLLINARDAMQPNGGTIEVKTWVFTPDTTAPPANGTDFSLNGVQTTGEQYAFSIKDSGCGIAPEIMDHIYDPFFTTKPLGKGTGLGLFIAKRIMRQHNGRIWAQNNPDGGATFTVVFPRKGRVPAETVAEQLQPSVTGEETVGANEAKP